MKARLILKYVEIDMSTWNYSRTYKSANRPPGFDGIAALLDGYDAS